jgi:hypothetical protein
MRPTTFLVVRVIPIIAENGPDKTPAGLERSHVLSIIQARRPVRLFRA